MSYVIGHLPGGGAVGGAVTCITIIDTIILNIHTKDAYLPGGGAVGGGIVLYFC
jgi:hypothetical protein